MPNRWELVRSYLSEEIRGLREDPWYDPFSPRLPALLVGWVSSVLGILLIVHPLVRGRVPPVIAFIPLAIGVLLLALTRPWPFRRRRPR